MLAACRQLNGCPVGEVCVTAGFRLPADYILHTVGPIYHRLVQRRRRSSSSAGSDTDDDNDEDDDDVVGAAGKRRRTDDSIAGIEEARRLLAACYRESLNEFAALCWTESRTIAADDERDQARFFIVRP